MTRPRIFITQPVHPSAIERLKSVADVDGNPDPLRIVSKEELIAAARASDILFCLLQDHVDADVIAANPKLRAVASMTITPADIDIAAASARRIPVTVIPAALLNDATADLAWALLFSVARRVTEGDRLMRSGIFPGSQSAYMEGGGVSRKTIGLIGMGGVGRASARRAGGFSMRVLYYDPVRIDPAHEAALGMTWVPLDTLLTESDFVSLHARLTPATRHLIGARGLALMKPSAYLINSARGPLVDEEALVHALETGGIAGAGLDVFEHEPQPHPKLLKMDNVVMTPHVGSAVGELRAVMANVVVDNIMAVLEGRQPPNCWNAEIFKNG
ncbi:MAG TPA: D-glycerate dehydrogenase [Burkholderiales bacterium]|nr:D-glycerate dehydrogenase [Burkholderiales bacterium]